MTRFNIIGRGFLDIEAGNAAGFTKTNPWFRFADVELGRSVEFSVPATTHNRIVLGFGDDPSEYGEQLRTRHACQLIYDGGQVMGTMTVTAYAGDVFSCVFLIGGASWIDRLQKMKLSECQSALNVYWVSGDGVPTTNVDYTQGVQLLRYDNGLGLPEPGWGIAPSVNVRYFLNEILTNLGVPHIINVTQTLYMVAGSMRNGQQDDVVFRQNDSSDIDVSQGWGYFDYVDINVEWATAILFGNYVGGGSNAIKAFKVMYYDLELTFDSVPADIFLIKWDMSLKNCQCLGGYPSNMSGIDEYWRDRFKDLTGETVELKRGDIFFFADYFGFVQSTNLWASSQILSQGYFGWQDNAHGITIQAVAAANVDLQLGEYWYMRNNMPDMTVFEFLKSVCLAMGYELTVDPVDGVTIGFGKYGDPKGDDFKALKRVLSVDRVARTAWGDNTAAAVVGFDSDEYVTDTIEVEYGIPNEVNTERKEWKSKFSEGNVGDNGVLIADIDHVSYKFTAKRWTLALAFPYLDTLQRIHSPVAVGYHDIAANSTAVTVKALLPLADFFAMKPSTTWLWRGCAYLWSKASWSDGVLTMEMQRVSAERVDMLPPPPTVTSIEAVFTQPQQPIVGTDNLDDLKQWLIVTAIFSDSSTRVLDANEYTLSGTLAYPSATVTVDYQGETDTFTVAVAYDAEVEYLESTGTQYIDTGITGDQDTKVMVEVSYYVESSIATSGRILGSRTNSPNRLAIGSNNGRSSESSYNFAQFGSNSSAAAFNIVFGVWRLMEVNSTGYYIDGVLQGLSFSARTFTTPQTMKLFAFDHNGNVGCGVVRVKSLKLIDGADLVRDFIPVRCGTTGYMYDRVSGQLFGNAGTGDFIVGADV